MDEIMVFVLGILGIFSVAGSAALLRVGGMIDRYPTPEEETRERGIASPIESTRIAVVMYWGLFALGGYALLQGSRNMMIIGITTLFAICLFLMTALFFSFAVLGTMKRRKRDAPAFILAPEQVPVPGPAPQQYAAVTKVRRPAASVMFDAFTKKD